VIILGLTSGLSSIAYCVLNFIPGSSQQIDCAVLAGSRMNISVFRRCNAHRLLISTLLERNPPAVIALGPAVKQNEPEDHVLAMRELMKSFGLVFRIPVLSFNDEKEIVTELRSKDDKGSRGLKLTGLVDYHLGVTMHSNRRVTLATGAALAAGARLGRKEEKSCNT
jgi:hypothetical protein